MIDHSSIFLDKAEESLTGAESELANGRFHNTANRAHYACFQAAIHALLRAGVRPSGGQWSHAFVPAQFDGLLINRRKLYPAELRGALSRNYQLREAADYHDDLVTRTEASRALIRARGFVQAVGGRGGGDR
jgi:uncharacterized protein (UPF0332 family)